VDLSSDKSAILAAIDDLERCGLVFCEDDRIISLVLESDAEIEHTHTDANGSCIRLSGASNDLSKGIVLLPLVES